MLRYLLIAMCLILIPTPVKANQQEMRERQCRYQWVDKGTWTAREEAITARCVVARWSVPGGLTTFIGTIECESHWYRLAYNPAGYVGLAQHDVESWSGRVRSYAPPLWGLSPRWQNSRTMLTITVRMVHSMGWGPWSCA